MSGVLLFQVYKEAIAKLRTAFYLNVTNADEIKRRNIALISNLGFIDGILKSTIYQTMANNKGIDKSQHRNTFLMRYINQCICAFYAQLNFKMKIISFLF